MVKYVKQLFPAIALFGLMIAACQKQEDVNQPNSNNSNSTNTNTTTLNPMSKVNTKDYRIPPDTAIAWTTRWRALNAKLNNQMPNSILIPKEGLDQLFSGAANNGQTLLGVRLYLSVDGNGQIKGTYVPVGLDNNDILNYGGPEANNNDAAPIYDGTTPPPPSQSSILNSSQQKNY